MLGETICDKCCSHPDRLPAIRIAVVEDDPEIRELLADFLRREGFVVASDAAAGLRAGRLVPVLDDWTLVDDNVITIVTPSGSHHASKTRAFADFLANRFRRMPWAGAAREDDLRK